MGNGQTEVEDKHGNEKTFKGVWIDIQDKVKGGRVKD